MSGKKNVNIMITQEKSKFELLRFLLILGIILVCCFLFSKGIMVTQIEEYAKPEKELDGEIFKERRDRFIQERSYIVFKTDGKMNMKQIKYKYRLSNQQVHLLIEQAGISCNYKPVDNNYMDFVGGIVPEEGKVLKINYQPDRSGR